MLVTIDGPAGAGKSTLARLLAARLAWEHIDSGALYRAAALFLEEERAKRAISVSDIGALVSVAEIRMIRGRTYVGPRDVTAQIRTSHIDQVVSRQATVGAFRKALTTIMRQHAIACENAIIDGRDIGSVVFPHADLKVYLDARLEARARRRLTERGGRDLDLMVDELKSRDMRDSDRAISPLVIPLGALVVDTTDLTATEVLEWVVRSLPHAD